MSADMPELEAYTAVVFQELRKGLEDACSPKLTDRRIAALYYLHSVLDPSHPCICDFCAFHVKHSSAFATIP